MDEPIYWVADRCPKQQPLGCSGQCIRYAGHAGEHSCEHYTRPEDGAVHPRAAWEIKLKRRREEIRAAGDPYAPHTVQVGHPTTSISGASSEPQREAER